MADAAELDVVASLFDLDEPIAADALRPLIASAKAVNNKTNITNNQPSTQTKQALHIIKHTKKGWGVRGGFERR